MHRSIDTLCSRLAALPGVLAVALGGSRARGEARPESDWDIGLYYRGSAETLDPGAIRQLGHRGRVVEIGEWGPLMNGGAWLTVAGRRVDLLYRDLDAIEAHITEARCGRFDILHLPGYLAGVPTYLVLAELALGRVLHGIALPRPPFPEALRRAAERRWTIEAQFSLDYAGFYAQRGARAECDAMLVRAGLAAAHARLASRGQWATNEKRLLAAAGLDDLRDAMASDRLDATCAEVRALLALGRPDWAGLL